MTDEVLDRKETSELVQVAEGTLRSWDHRNYGPPSFRVGGRVRYRRSSVERWLAEQEQAGAERRGVA